MPWRLSRSGTGLGPGERSGQGGRSRSTSAHKSSSTIHGRVPTPSRTAESSHPSRQPALSTKIVLRALSEESPGTAAALSRTGRSGWPQGPAKVDPVVGQMATASAARILRRRRLAQEKAAHMQRLGDGARLRVAHQARQVIALPREPCGSAKWVDSPVAREWQSP